jgi:eukaryotic-like serine/threonine-protein kinase
VSGGAGPLGQGHAFTTAGRRPGVVEALIGSGGQGDVYRVRLDGAAFALKWYHPHYVAIDTGLRARLERAVQRGAPTADFLWPLDLVDSPGTGSFGYIMPLRADAYRSIRDLIAPPPDRLELPLERRAAACLHLAHAFLALHASGFCYQDINFGNIFLEPDSGRVLICDNDNVNVDGADASIYGTRKFMAPEVVRRETLPNSRTDQFSMAVLFFYALFGWHPLDGRREAEVKLMNPGVELRLYGTEPLFLFDPADPGNGPVEGFHDFLVARWRSLPASLRRLFERAFGAGLHDPHARVVETEWRAALAAVVDGTVACAACGFEHVADPAAAGAPLPEACLACGTALAAPAMLLLPAGAVVLTAGRAVAARLLGLGGDAPAARVEAHPTRPELIGLRNLTERTWQAVLPSGAVHAVAPGQAVRAVPGASIAFGRATGRIAGGAEAAAAAEAAA